MSLRITKSNFNEEVVNSDKPVLVDFWAQWCGPCRMIAPVIDELANELDDVKVGKINVDEEPTLAERFNVSSIPTLIVFEKGEIKARQVGMANKQALLALLGK